MLLGLLVAPLAPTAVSLAWGFWVDPETFDFPAWRGFVLAVAIVVVVEVWAIGTGMLWLYTIARSRGGVGRWGSVTMGSICAFLFPIFGTFFGALIVNDTNFSDFWAESGGITILTGFPGLLGGAVGGLIFWRISIRPAATEDPETFD